MTLVVALHGFLGQSSDFDFLKMALKSCVDSQGKPIQFWAPDMYAPNSNWGPNQSMFEWSRQLNLKVLDWPGITRRILVGYSQGGRLGVKVLMDRPQVWDHSLLISSNPLEMSDWEKSTREKWDLSWANKFKEDRWDLLMEEWNSLSVFSSDLTEAPIRYEEDYDRESLAESLRGWSPRAQEATDFEWTKKTGGLNWLVGLKDSKYLAIQERLNELARVGNYWQTTGGHRLLWDNPDWITRWTKDMVSKD